MGDVAAEGVYELAVAVLGLSVSRSYDIKNEGMLGWMCEE